MKIFYLFFSFLIFFNSSEPAFAKIQNGDNSTALAIAGNPETEVFYHRQKRIHAQIILTSFFGLVGSWLGDRQKIHAGSKAYFYDKRKEAILKKSFSAFALSQKIEKILIHAHPGMSLIEQKKLKNLAWVERSFYANYRKIKPQKKLVPDFTPLLAKNHKKVLWIEYSLQLKPAGLFAKKMKPVLFISETLFDLTNQRVMKKKTRNIKIPNSEASFFNEYVQAPALFQNDFNELMKIYAKNLKALR